MTEIERIIKISEKKNLVLKKIWRCKRKGKNATDHRHIAEYTDGYRTVWPNEPLTGYSWDEEYMRNGLGWDRLINMEPDWSSTDIVNIPSPFPDTCKYSTLQPIKELEPVVVQLYNYSRTWEQAVEEILNKAASELKVKLLRWPICNITDTPLTLIERNQGMNSGRDQKVTFCWVCEKCRDDVPF